MLESTHLSTLLAIADFGNFSRAAEELGITQSAVSQNLKRLETIVGVPLVSKTAKVTTLTPAGEKLVELARDYFAKVQTTLDDINEATHSMSGALRVGTFMGIGKSWVAPKMIAFSKLYPEMKLRLIMDFQENLVESFEKHRLDALVVPTSAVPAFVDAVKICDEMTTLVLPKNATFQNPAKIPIKELMEFPWIGFQERDPLMLNWCKAHYGHVPRTYNLRLVMNSFSHILQAVAEGLGAAVIPTHVLKHYAFLKDQIQTLGPEYQVKANELYFVMQQGSAAHHRLKTLQDFFMQNNDEDIL